MAKTGSASTPLAVSRAKDEKKAQALLAGLYEMRGNANISCGKFTNALKALGFEIRDSNKGGHKVLKHRCVPNTQTPHFNCGHNQGAEVQKVYINTIIRFVETYEEEIKSHLIKKSSNETKS